MDLLIRLHEAGLSSCRVLPPASSKLRQIQPIPTGKPRTVQAPWLQRQPDAVMCQPGPADYQSNAILCQPGSAVCQCDTVPYQPGGDLCQPGVSSSQPGSSLSCRQHGGSYICTMRRCVAAIMTCLKAAPMAVAAAVMTSRRTGRIRQVLWPPAVTSGRRLEALGNMRATRSLVPATSIAPALPVAAIMSALNYVSTLNHSVVAAELLIRSN